MRKFALLIILLCPLLSLGQSFDITTKSLGNLLKFAADQNKLLFIYAHATWCKPCKYMEDSVFTDNIVDKALVDNFYPVKLQMDATKYDSPDVKGRYDLCKLINSIYKIAAFPTYLILDSNGDPVHIGIGSKSKSEMLTFFKEALQPNKQYFTLVKRFKDNSLPISSFPYLTELAYQVGDSKTALGISKKYIDNHLLKLRFEELLVDSNLNYLVMNTKSSKDPGFIYLFKRAKAIDNAIKKNDYVENMLNGIITKENIMVEHTGLGHSPNWKIISKKIKAKYGNEYAERAIVFAAEDYYLKKKDWFSFNKFLVQQLVKFPLDTTNSWSDYRSNQYCWYGLVEHSNDFRQLNAGIITMEGALRRNPKMGGWYDTYAHLLYKTGSFEKAIAAEEKAMQISPNDKSIASALEKMKKRQLNFNDL